MDQAAGTVGGMTGPVDDAELARRFELLFRRTYLQFHRRDGKRSEMTGASRAVLTHLAHTGPLTVGEAAQHLDRAQSVVSDIVTGLVGKGLLEREPDPADRRRTLVWLTPAGLAELERQDQVLSLDLLAGALGRMPAAHRDALLAGLRALTDAADPAAGPQTDPDPEGEPE